MIAHLFLAALLLQVGSADAATGQSFQQVAASDDAKASGSDKDLEKRICKTYRVTGSRAKRERVCMTKAQWADYERLNRDFAREMTNTGICADGSVCSGS